MAEFLSEEHPRARVPHECCSCQKFIDVGEVHLRQTLKDGDVYSLRYHLDCRKAEEKANKEYDAGEWMFLWEVLEDGGRDARMWLANDYPTVAARLGISVYEWCDTWWWIDAKTNPFFWVRAEHSLR